MKIYRRLYARALIPSAKITALDAIAGVVLEDLSADVVSPTALGAGNGVALENVIRSRTFVIIHNADGADVTATIDVTTEVAVANSEEKLAIDDPEVVIPAGDTVILGPFTSQFEQDSGLQHNSVCIDFAGSADPAEITCTGLKIA